MEVELCRTGLARADGSVNKIRKCYSLSKTVTQLTVPLWKVLLFEAKAIVWMASEKLTGADSLRRQTLSFQCCSLLLQTKSSIVRFSSCGFSPNWFCTPRRATVSLGSLLEQKRNCLSCSKDFILENKLKRIFCKNMHVDLFFIIRLSSIKFKKSELLTVPCICLT